MTDREECASGKKRTLGVSPQQSGPLEEGSIPLAPFFKGERDVRNVSVAGFVISTDGICAKCRSRVVRYYVRQKWRNLAALAG